MKSVATNVDIAKLLSLRLKNQLIKFFLNIVIVYYNFYLGEIMLKIIISFIISMLFAGCLATNQTSVTYEKYKPNDQSKILHVNKTKKLAINNKPVNGMIKGHITNLKYDNGAWEYRIESIDLSNKKLPVAQFRHTKKLANEGDLVYVIIKNTRLQELLLIEKANYKRKMIRKKNKKIKKLKIKTHKRTKQRQVLGVPSAEEIKLD